VDDPIKVARSVDHIIARANKCICAI
jgi:hypothetical protein